MDTHVVLFVEGDTDKCFYDSLLKVMHSMCPNDKFSVRKVHKCNVKGIGNYKKMVVNKFKNDFYTKYKGNYIIAVLCYDSDAVELSQHPVINFEEVKKALIAAGADRVIGVRAKANIEDWFLYDLEGVLRYLKLPLDTNPNGKTGYDRLKNLFSKNNRLYIKGKEGKPFIDSLNLNKIMGEICKELSPLCRILGVRCKGNKCK